MPDTASRRYAGQGLQPCIYPEAARRDAVVPVPGEYSAGEVLGQFTTLTAANDVQTITITGTPTGGTFKIEFNGEVTEDITFSAVAATLAANITAALEALDGIGTGNVTVSASVTVPAITFSGDLANRWMPLATAYVNGLTGGTTPDFSIAHTTPGRTAGGAFAPYDDAASDGTNIARAICAYDATVDTFGNVTVGGGEFGTEKTLPVFTAGYFRTADLTGIDANGVGDLGKIVQGAVGSLSSTATILRVT